MADISVVVTEEPQLVTIIVTECGPATASGPIRATSADFTDATTFDHAAIIGQDLAIFFNNIPRYLEADEWAATATGIQILIPGFDATANNYTFYIQIVY